MHHPLREGVHADARPRPSYGQVAAAIRRGSALTAGTTLLKPQDVERMTREVMAVMDPDQPAGEHGDVPAIRNGLGGLTGPHDRQDAWRGLTADERRGDGRSVR